MIMIFTALYCEAQPLIQYYHLKKNNDINRFQVFQNGDVLLAITGTGSISAAAAVSHICTLFPAENSVFLVNIGVCGAREEYAPAGSIFLCNKIIEEATKRTFYPDMLFKHPFSESGIVTCSTVVREAGLYSDKERIEGLFDMEAAGIYQAAAYYLQPHQTAFLKIVSDYGTRDRLMPEKIAGLMDKNLKVVTDWLESIGKIKFEDRSDFTPEEEACIADMARKLLCSVTMEHRLRQLICYYKLVNGSFTGIVEEFSSHNHLPCKTKAEGKRCLEKLIAELV